MLTVIKIKVINIIKINVISLIKIKVKTLIIASTNRHKTDQ